MDPPRADEEAEGEAVVARAKDTVHQLYQLFKTHPHGEQWTKEAKPLSRVSWGWLWDQRVFGTHGISKLVLLVTVPWVFKE